MTKRYLVTVASVQTWSYVYEVDAENEEEAEKLGYTAHKNGKDSIDNWVDGEDFWQIGEVEEVNI